METNDFKSLPVSSRLRAVDSIAEEVAKIVNEAKAKADEILKPTGYSLNINADFVMKTPEPKE